MGEPSENRIQVVYLLPVLAANDAAPFIGELEAHFGNVEARPINSEPPAAGFSEISMVLTALGGVVSVAFITGFFEELGSESARQLREGLRRVLERGRRNYWGRKYSPLCIELGQARFHFHQPLSEDELLKRIRKADELVKSLPPEAYDGRPQGPMEYGFFWDTETEQWRGELWQLYGKYWFPPRFWES